MMMNLIHRVTHRDEIPNLLHAIDAQRICEVGVRNGEHLQSLLASTADVVVAVDMWQETGKRSENDDCYTQAELDEQCAHVAKLDDRVHVDRNPSIIAATHYPDGYFDFVYLDADHTEAAVDADIAAWWPKVRAGGILAGHDYFEVSPVCKDGTQIRFGVIPAVTRFVVKLGLSLHVDRDYDWFVVKPMQQIQMLLTNRPSGVTIGGKCLDVAEKRNLWPGPTKNQPPQGHQGPT